MKNNIVFKFIAIVLCAASLTGIIGGITGIVALSEGDLYNKTVDQVKKERIQLNASQYADELARMYAGTELGGCPEEMVLSRSGWSDWFVRQYPNMGYTIQDAKGNSLSSYNPQLKDSATVYSFPVTGQYMHLISQESRTQVETQIAQEEAKRYEDLISDNSGNIVPEEGIAIDEAVFIRMDGSLLYRATSDGSGYVNAIYYQDSDNSMSVSYGHPRDYAGYLFYTMDGHLSYTSYLSDGLNGLVYEPIAEISLINRNEGFYFTLSDYENGLGTLNSQGEPVKFLSNFTIDPKTNDETIPEETSGWAVETIPGSEDSVTITKPDGTSLTVSLAPALEETQPAETIPQKIAETTPETYVEETLPPEETVPSSASAIPEATEEIESSVAAEETVPSETVIEETLPAETLPEETAPQETEPQLINGKPLTDYQVNNIEYYNEEIHDSMNAKFVYVPLPELTVEVYIDETSMLDAPSYALLEIVRSIRSYLLPIIGGCLLIFAIMVVYLCTAAGRTPKSEEVRAGGLNRIPLDLYLFGGCFIIAGLLAIMIEAINTLLRINFLLGCSLAAASVFAACLIFVGFCFAFVAQIKTPGGFWWKNTLCGICIRLFFRFAIWLESGLSDKGYPWLGKTLKKLWRFTCKSTVWLYHAFENSLLWIGGKLALIFRWIGNKLRRFFSLLPLTWQWLLCGIVMILSSLLVQAHNTFFVLLGIFIPLAIVFYGSHCFGLLAESTKRMSKGDLNTKVEDQLMVGCFESFADDLNALADVAVVAAQKQLKSERMKTELITNVSHDIKTPLTSIINYVDLLQKPHTEEEALQYLEVLDRQSQRLKKLIDDLMDMSKANTGNMAVDISLVDAVESVNQALGEFADKLDKAQLIPVFRHDDPHVPMMADGKLVWRVLCNLLTNAVKYAMPGTRLYIDLITMEGKVIISLKNISREELNVDADELLERFVRGDDARNTEGSGLGLNIAKSLMELQKGQLQLLVDGDLFKVTLIFPGI